MKAAASILLILCAALASCSVRSASAPEDESDAQPVASVTTLSATRPDFRPRVIHDSGWKKTGDATPRQFRIRIYAGESSTRHAFVVYGHLGGTDGVRYPAPEMKFAEQEVCDFEDSDRLIDLRAGFAWVRFAPLPPPGTGRVVAPKPEPESAWRLFSTHSLFVDPVGTEFILATSKRSRFDVVYVTSPGAVEVSQRYVPGSQRIRIGGEQLVRRGGLTEPTFNVESVTATELRRQLAADILTIVRAAIDQYNQLPDTVRPTRPLNPPAFVESPQVLGKSRASPPDSTASIDDELLK